MVTFNELYKDNNFYYGSNPSFYLEMLIKQKKLIKGDALDIGCGDGRNSIYLAMNGFRVFAIDNSEEAIKKLKELSIKNNLEITPIVEDVLQFEYMPDRYSLIVANTIIDHLELNDGNQLIYRLKRSLKKNGVIFVAVFTVDDPGNNKLFDHSDTAQFVKRYFHSIELKNLFSDLTLLHYIEEEFLDQHHGKPHYHNMARIIAKKEKD
jgi:2-polyprenyl-3-methyl-5-hydroxy-6-metoxy-1,4-benzoquinol methylase